jgi:MFS transporter, DHA1 family, tetracycline resistance protein
MRTPQPTDTDRAHARGALLPLYAAGFVTAFGAHSIAASLGGYTGGQHASLLYLGLLLAVYDGAEVVLKPVFGSLADRIGARPVLLGGLLAFAAASAAFVLAGNPAWVGLARLGQGAAAAAFSPAAGVLVARLTPEAGWGRGFGRYGAWKGLGYGLGPVLGGVLIAVGGYSLLFATLAGLGVLVAGWALAAVPAAPPLPRGRRWPTLPAGSPAPGSCDQPSRWLPPPPPSRSALGSCPWWAPRAGSALWRPARSSHY